jgi:hypothetical protein
MGIFSRLFQRGQDGNPTDGAAAEDDGSALAAAIDELSDEPEIMLTPAMATNAQGSAPQPPPASAPAQPNPPALPGLTPAFASAGGAAVPHTTAEPARSMWEWPGSQREPRRAGPSTPSSPSGSGAGSGSGESPSPEPRTPSRAGALPSVPRTQTSESAPTAPPKDREAPVQNATMILSPPPAPTPAPAAPASTPAPRAARPSPSPPPAAKPASGTSPPPTRAAPRTSPPAAAAPAAPAPTPPPAAPRTPDVSAAPAGRPARRPHTDSVTSAFDLVIEPRTESGPVDGISTAEDLAEVRRLFHEVAVSHVAQVRDVMLELRYGEAQPSWIESTTPALRSLRAMAAQMELADLCAALDEFCVAVDRAVDGRSRIDDAAKTALLARYQKLVELIPQAFELDAERDRREPIIVEALLHQIEGVEKRTIEKLFAVGLSRLEALLQATADEIAVVAGIRQELADAIVEQFRGYKVAASAALSAPDPLAERRQLGDLLIMMSVQNDEYNHAATKWSDEARARKREARKQRDQTFQRIKVALARLGERDQLARLEKLPFDERIAALDRYLSAAVPARPQPSKP